MLERGRVQRIRWSSNGLFGYCTCCRHSVNCGSLGKQTARIKYCKSRCACCFVRPRVSEGLKTAIMKGPRSRVSSGIEGTCSALVCLNIHVLMLIFVWGDRAIGCNTLDIKKKNSEQILKYKASYRYWHYKQLENNWASYTKWLSINRHQTQVASNTN